MKLVCFNRDMRPQHRVGDRRLVPDGVALRLAAEGAATVVPSRFDRSPAAPEPAPRGRRSSKPLSLIEG